MEAVPYIPLPQGLVDPRTTAAAVFDSIAALYDRARPGYPPAALADLRRLGRVDESTRILEVGCGTGQLTRDLARSGASIRALEPGRALGEIAHAHLAAWPRVTVVTTPFESFEDEPDRYDLVVSATAFHWIDPEVGYPKTASFLRSGGWLALMTNTHTRGGTHAAGPFADGVRDLHRTLVPEIGAWSFPTAGEIEERAGGGGDVAAVWSRIERKLSEGPDVSAWFEPPVVKTYPWVATYGRDSYLDMLASQSSYALMEPGRREQLLLAIGRLVDDDLGGTVTKEYVTVLAAARRRAPALDDPPAVPTSGGPRR